MIIGGVRQRNSTNFVMKMVFNKVGDSQTPINLLYDGLKYLFLDAIYNDGQIETLYKTMNLFSKELDKLTNCCL